VSAVEPGVLPASWPASADCAGVPPFHTHPYVDYPEGTTYQLDEHVLELGRAHLLELQDALDRMPRSGRAARAPRFHRLARRSA
jgi:hypothetical protein